METLNTPNTAYSSWVNSHTTVYFAVRNPLAYHRAEPPRMGTPSFPTHQRRPRLSLADRDPSELQPPVDLSSLFLTPALLLLLSLSIQPWIFPNSPPDLVSLSSSRPGALTPQSRAMGQGKVRSRHFYRDTEASGYTPVSFLILCSLGL